MANVVKQILRNSYSESERKIVPIGTDGNLVDMKSVLNLEEELKIGGNKYTNIYKPESVNYTITQEYYSSSPISQISSQTTGSITHTVISYIKDIGEFNIIYPIQVHETQNQILGEGDTEVVSVSAFSSDNGIQIMVNYYQGFADSSTSDSNIYHQKLIAIVKQS